MSNPEADLNDPLRDLVTLAERMATDKPLTLAQQHAGGLLVGAAVRHVRFLIAAGSVHRAQRKPSAVEPRFHPVLSELAVTMRELADSVEDVREQWQEWDAHVQTWLFSPETLTAELICAGALRNEIKEYVKANKPPELWPGSQYILSEAWGDAFWSWLMEKPIAAEMLRQSLISATCFLTEVEGINGEFATNVREQCLEYIRQRTYEPYKHRAPHPTRNQGEDT